MDWNEFKSKWVQAYGQSSEQSGKCTDDLTANAGDRDKLVEKLQDRYGITREEAEKKSDSFAKGSCC